jgi:hypothetical protein
LLVHILHTKIAPLTSIRKAKTLLHGHFDF